MACSKVRQGVIRKENILVATCIFPQNTHPCLGTVKIKKQPFCSRWKLHVLSSNLSSPAEVTEVASINLVALGTKDHVMTPNKIIQIITPSLCKAWVRMLQSSLWLITSSRLALLRQIRKLDSP